ncbi:MAG: redoxin domain-containing protein [Deltaproteobacteria bacterium]|nr:redoxin domain-containing protein [Deltaproteobacteria bacterium]
MATIEKGAEAPDFELPSNIEDNGRPGKKIKLSDYRGTKNVVLAFYPLSFSPICTRENACFKDDLPKFDSADTQVLGISVDSHWVQHAFAKQQGIPYPLLCDFNPKGAVGAKYGLYLEDKGFDARATVIVDKAGKVAWVKVQDLGAARDDAEILAALAALS